MTLSTSVERRRRFACRALLSVTTILCSGLAAPAFAQVDPTSFPAQRTLDGFDVDIPTGQIHNQSLDLSIGSGDHALALRRLLSRPDDLKPVPFEFSMSAVLDQNTGDVQVQLFDATKQFRFAGHGTYTNVDGTGETFDSNGYVDRNGVRYEFGYGSGNAGNNSLVNRVSRVVYPDGYTVNVGWETAIQSASDSPDRDEYADRLIYVSDSANHLIRVRYIADHYDYGIIPGGFNTLASATAINTTAQQCGDSNNFCHDVTAPWPTVSYAYSGNYTAGAITVSGPGAASKSYSWSAITDIAVHDGVEHLSAHVEPWDYDQTHKSKFEVTRNGVTATYIYTGPAGVPADTAVVTVPGLDAITYKLASGHIQFVASGGNTTQYQYDTLGRLTSTTLPDGNGVNTAYDARGNVTQVTTTPKSGSGVTTFLAHFDSDCTNTATCNSPRWIQDANQNQTDYSYDPTTGQVLTTTAPAPTAGAVRPQVRYTYSSIGGVSILTDTSRCRTKATCVGTDASDAVNTHADYDANLQQTGMTVGAGDGSLSAKTSTTYDAIGNVLTSTDPLGNVTKYRWDTDGRMVGVVGPNPGGTDGNPNLAARISYNADGQVTLAEQGTVASQSDSDWSNFSSRYQAATVYDENGRKTKESAQAGGATNSLVQYSYDIAGRLDCTALRMNPTVYDTLPGACDLGRQGSFGPDQISRNEYDGAGRVTKVWDGYRTGDAAASQTSYTPNGKVGSVTDQNGNLTTYTYDVFDRLYRTYYPNPSGAGSSTTDYEQTEYDAAGNLNRRWLRGTGNHQDYVHDALNRLTSLSVPDLNASDHGTSYTYDNLGQLTSANEDNNVFVKYDYDALGREKSEESRYGGKKMFGYDLAGRRTNLTWPDNVSVSYTYDNLGRMVDASDTSGAKLFHLTYSTDGLRSELCPYDGSGNQSLCTKYDYDGAGRLNTQTLLGNTGTAITLSKYSPAGQIGQRDNTNDAYAWTGAANASKSYVPNGLNQYASVGGLALGYDPHGNLTSWNGNSYSYDSFNRLGEFNGGQSAGNWLYYDSLGRLNWSNATQTRLDYDGSRLIAELDGNNNIRRRYVYGPNADEPIVWYEGAGTGDKRFLQTDERGSVIRVQRTDGSTLATNTYDEYGNPGANNQGRFGYTGQIWLPELGLWHYKTRMYAPSLGRFIQTDPIGYGDGLNWYNYVGGDPVNATDPSGLFECPHGYHDLSQDPVGCDYSAIASLFPHSYGGGSDQGYSPGQDNIDRDREKARAGASPNLNLRTGLGMPQNDIVVTAKKYAKRFGQCVAAQYGFGDGTVSAGLDLGKIASEIGGIPLPKRLLGIPLAGGEGVSKFTNLISYVPFKLGIRANTGLQILGSGRVFGVLGRLNAPVAAALAAYDAASIAICTAGE